MADPKPANLAILPGHNATVLASAGTGKTWLLVTRIIHLLLAGASPDTILAITFTRKAAKEMHTRLMQRSFELAGCTDKDLEQIMHSMDLSSTPENQSLARRLYEKLLYSERPITITTFHAFAQNLLRRFPLEAGVPPGFELADKTALLEQRALERLLNDATNEPDGDTAKALDTLFDHCGGSALSALQHFLMQRSDWWAFTEGHHDVIRFASEKLAQQLGITAADTSLEQFFHSETDTLREFGQLLERHVTATNLEHARILTECTRGTGNQQQHFREITKVFLTQEGELRQRNSSKKQLKSLGDSGEQRFLALHAQLGRQIQACLERQCRLKTLDLSRSWFVCGAHLLEHYQRIKTEQGLLDFNDLEWKTYRLLNHSDNAEWVQYKLDQRIDHLLVDEFQDTTPTQWNLILPLLRELASGETERMRSVFLVGDSKQSIYRFRRANPKLLETARSWLADNLCAISQSLDLSWRSAPAIVNFVNQVFSAPPLSELLEGFKPHRTHHHSLPGDVELLPLVSAIKKSDHNHDGVLRNPLYQPRLLDEDQRHYQEGQLIASRIRALLDQNTPVNEAACTRPLRYSDILILVRYRTHAHSYEKALRESNIPYFGADRGTLLNSLEIADMLALLDSLSMPFDNLALAQVLRSPLFSCSDDDLMLLADSSADALHSPWISRLACLATSLPHGSPLQRAHQWLTEWRSKVGFLPIHDLLDRIYHQGDVIARYESAFPQHLKERVRSNLTRLIELALDVDSGRYPSLAHFRVHLQSLKSQRDAPDEVSAHDMQSSVRIMTIHAAKGLEAPVVFLADAASTKRTQAAYHALIKWPEHEPRPSNFLLTAKKTELDSVSKALLNEQEQADLREDANLLYVALTRAKQFLFISACSPSRSANLGWYGIISAQTGLPH